MSTDSLRPGHPPDFVKPLLHTYDRLQARETLQPEQVTARAQALLIDYFGPSAEAAEAAFAHGCLSLIGEHTHFFDGFAVMLPLPHGMAVAVRPATGPATRIALEGRGIWTLPATEALPETWPLEARVLATGIRRLAGAPVEMAVVGTVSPCAQEALLSTLVLAGARALQALLALPLDTPALLRQLGQDLAADTGRPFSPAYLLASDAATPGHILLVDTQLFDTLSLEAPTPDQVCWGLMAPPEAGADLAVDFHRKMHDRARAALDALRKQGFPLDSFRDLEHQDLRRALARTPRRLRPVVRHLVLENRNVQKLVTAVRRRDWQMFGSLLLISHGSYQKDWGNTGPGEDFLVEQARARTHEGMYGARMSGAGGGVLMMGRSFSVPEHLDRIAQAFADRFGDHPYVLLF